MVKSILLSLFGLQFFLLSCSNDINENTLSTKDLEFIQGLGILDSNEIIEMFECNGGFSGTKQSGNFITNKRIANYWIVDDQREINSALFHSEIDSITSTDLVTKLTYASYLTVYKKDGSTFNVYVDADSARTYQFFNKAMDTWEKNRVIK